MENSSNLKKLLNIFTDLHLKEELLNSFQPRVNLLDYSLELVDSCGLDSCTTDCRLMVCFWASTYLDPELIPKHGTIRAQFGQKGSVGEPRSAQVGLGSFPIGLSFGLLWDSSA